MQRCSQQAAGREDLLNPSFSKVSRLCGLAAPPPLLPLADVRKPEPQFPARGHNGRPESTRVAPSLPSEDLCLYLRGNHAQRRGASRARATPSASPWRSGVKPGAQPGSWMSRVAPPTSSLMQQFPPVASLAPIPMKTRRRPAESQLAPSPSPNRGTVGHLGGLGGSG